MLSISAISVQVQERYQTISAIDRPSEQTFNLDAKIPDDIKIFLNQTNISVQMVYEQVFNT